MSSLAAPLQESFHCCSMYYFLHTVSSSMIGCFCSCSVILASCIVRSIAVTMVIMESAKAEIKSGLMILLWSSEILNSSLSIGQGLEVRVWTPLLIAHRGWPLERLTRLSLLALRQRAHWALIIQLKSRAWVVSPRSTAAQYVEAKPRRIWKIELSGS